MIGRRGFLAGAAAAAAGAMAGCGSDRPSGVPSASPGRTVSGSFVSKYRGDVRTGWTIARPPSHDDDRLPVLVVLHGRGGDHEAAFGGGLYLDRYLAGAVAGGSRPFAIASVDGGDHDYWHPRRSSDAAGMVIHEFLPLLASRGLDTRRIGLLGWSMGGYGALYLSTVLRAAEVAVAVAESPAIWHEAGQSAPGAFDDAADFDAHTIFGRQRLLTGIALRVDCGASDGFAPVTRDLRASLTPTPAGGIEPGGHDWPYWRSQAPDQLAFVGAHLG